MSLKWPAPGEFSIGHYQVAARPYVIAGSLSDGEVREINFPQITQFITIRNAMSGAVLSGLSVGFTQLGLSGTHGNFDGRGGEMNQAPAVNPTGLVNNNFFILVNKNNQTDVPSQPYQPPENPERTLPLRLTSIFLSNSRGDNHGRLPFEVIAGLTEINSKNAFKLTGSNGCLGVG